MNETTPTVAMNWDLTNYLPEFQGPEMVRLQEILQKDIVQLQKTITTLAPLSEDNQTEWQSIFTKNESHSSDSGILSLTKVLPISNDIRK